MARTDVTKLSVARNAKNAASTTAIDPTNGHKIKFGKARKLLIRINATFSGAKAYTFKAGVGGDTGPAQKAGQGDLVLSLNAEVAYVHLDAERFMQVDGYAYLDVAASSTGTIEAIALP